MAAAGIKSKAKGIMDELGVERFYFTSEALGERLYIFVENLSPEEQAKMTRVHQREVPPLVSTKMDSFPFFYFFPQSYTHCIVTAADLEAMHEIFHEDFNKTMKWPTARNIAHCPACGHSNVYIGRFCIQPIVKSYFEGPESTLNVCRHFMPRVFHEECYKQLAKQSSTFGVSFPSQPKHKYHGTTTGFAFPMLTEQWLKVQRLVRALDKTLRLCFPSRTFSGTIRKQLDDATCLEKFIQNVTYPEMMYYAGIAGLNLGVTQEDFDSSTLFPTDAEYYRNAGHRAISAKEYDQAINCYTKSIRACPSNYMSWAHRSIALTALHKFEESLMGSEECIKLNPTWVKGYLFLALSHLHLEWYDVALNTLVLASNIDPSDICVANKLLMAVSLSYTGTGIIHFVKVAEDEQYEQLHAFIVLLCRYICKLCSINAGVPDDPVIEASATNVRNLVLDKQNAARLAYRLSIIDIPEVKRYTEIFGTIAGPTLRDYTKSQKRKKSTKGKGKGKQTQKQPGRDVTEEVRLVELQKREHDLMLRIKVNRHTMEGATKLDSKDNTAREFIREAILNERRELDQELSSVQNSRVQIEEAIKKRNQTNSGGDAFAERQSNIPCKKKYTTEQLRALPWKLIEKALRNGVVSEARVEPSQEEFWTIQESFTLDALVCGCHASIGSVLAEFLLGNYNASNMEPTTDAGPKPQQQSTIGQSKSSSRIPDLKDILASMVPEPGKAPLFPSHIEGLPSLKEGLSQLSRLHANHQLKDVVKRHSGRTTADGEGTNAKDGLGDTEDIHDAMSSLEDLGQGTPTGPEDINELDGILDATKENSCVLRDQTSLRAKQRKCARCEGNRKLSKCGNCLKVYYCSRECQKLHRTIHKVGCK